MAHLPLLLHPAPKDVLVICFGMGTTVRSVSVHKGVECDAVELVPEVIDCFPYFHADAAEVRANPRIRCHVDDGRNYLLMRPKLYDMITIDPAPPLWSAGTVNLYSREFFALCKTRLKDRGILCMWVPFYTIAEMQLVMKSFQTVFENTYAYMTPENPPSGVYLIGYQNPNDPAQRGFRHSEDEPAILADLNEWGPICSSVDDLLRPLIMLSPGEVANRAAEVPVITDDHPYTEFPLWRDFE
jgi:spermidine synthase